MSDECSASAHDFAQLDKGRIFCRKCGTFRGAPNFAEGMIAMWSGELSKLPTKWQLCDDANGTQDLRDKFIVGSGGGYAQGSMGGTIKCKLEIINIPSQTHFRREDQTAELSVIERNIKACERKDLVFHRTNPRELNCVLQDTSVATTPLEYAKTGTGGTDHHTPIDIRPPYYAAAFNMLISCY
jgi:hypothetical protein